MRSRLAVLSLLALSLVACDHGPANAPVPMEAGVTKSGGNEAGSSTVTVSSAPITSVNWGSQNDAGGVSVICPPDGAARITFINRGFSSAGAEIIPRDKKIDPAIATQRYRDAEAIAKALPQGSKIPMPPAADVKKIGMQTLDLQRADGTNVHFEWPANQTNPDARVEALAVALKVLAN